MSAPRPERRAAPASSARRAPVLSPPRMPDADPAVDAPLTEQYEVVVSAGLVPRRVDLALRALDLAIAGGALLVLSPLLVVIAAAVRLAAGAPVLYRGRRVGRHGRSFTMIKFRTLEPDAETRLGAFPGDELTQLTIGEQTTIGRFLRAMQLDELPQLYNVARGDMSIVGPRPIRPAFFRELTEQIPQYWQRLVVRPGLTGFAQLRLDRELSWSEKLSHDLEYVADRSVGLYLRVVLATIWRLVSHPGRHARKGPRKPSEAP